MINLLNKFNENYNKCADLSDKTYSTEKANRVFSKLQGSFKIKGSDEFVSEIEREIKYLMGWKAGRVLFKNIIKDDKEIPIVEGKINQHDRQDGSIEIKPRDPKITNYYCSANEWGEVRLVKYPDPSLCLLHEFCHKYKHRERKSRYLNGLSDHLLNPWLTNMEEQIVITGLDTSEEGKDYTPFNESHFLMLAECPMRVNHLALNVPINELPSFSDYATLSIGSMKEMGEIDVNAPQKIHDCPYLILCDKMITPLTAACSSINEKLVQELLEKGAKVEVPDEIGGPFFGAIYYDRVTLLPLLIEKGADINGRDNEKNTPLMITLLRGNMPSFKF